MWATFLRVVAVDSSKWSNSCVARDSSWFPFLFFVERPVVGIVSLVFFVGTIWDPTQKGGISRPLYYITMFYCVIMFLWLTVGVYEVWFPIRYVYKEYRSLEHFCTRWWPDILHKVNCHNDKFIFDTVCSDPSNYTEEWNEALFKTMDTHEWPSNLIQDLHSFHNPTNQFPDHVPHLVQEFRQAQTSWVEQIPGRRFLRWAMSHHTRESILGYKEEWTIGGKSFKKSHFVEETHRFSVRDWLIILLALASDYYFFNLLWEGNYDDFVETRSYFTNDFSAFCFVFLEK